MRMWDAVGLDLQQRAAVAARASNSMISAQGLAALLLPLGVANRPRVLPLGVANRPRLAYVVCRVPSRVPRTLPTVTDDGRIMHADGRQLRLSPSAVSSFRQCRFLYLLRHIERRPEPATPELAAGEHQCPFPAAITRQISFLCT